ncbi:MAG: DNA modification system-associated small protein [Candidatus Nanopelagicaceae bacterium]
MTRETDDLPLRTLLDIRTEGSTQISENLLIQCYTTQKKHQFNDDRTISLTAMESLIDDAVAKLMSSQEE